MRYAVVSGNTVVNTIVWNGISAFKKEEGLIFVASDSASIGDQYDSGNNAFIAPSTYPSWIFNNATLSWEPPVPIPSEGGPYTWDEGSLSWISL